MMPLCRHLCCERQTSLAYWRRRFPAGPADLVNIAVVLGFDAAVLYTCGFKALIYLLLGTVMGGGMHPMAGHLISEHYMFIKVSQHLQHLSTAFISLCDNPPLKAPEHYMFIKVRQPDLPAKDCGCSAFCVFLTESGIMCTVAAPESAEHACASLQSP